MEPLRFVSLMAPLDKPFYEGLCAQLRARTGLPVEFVEEGSWEDRMRLLLDGEVDFGFVCGLQYVQQRDHRNRPWHPLVASVMAGARYQNAPVYYSDVVVRSQSAYQKFDDLRESTWSFNECTSHSGYNVAKAYLADRGWQFAFFKAVMKGHAHQNSLQLILNEVADAAAIDSTVLESELNRDPGLRDRIRIIQTLGPSPMPPCVVLPSVGPEERRLLSEAMVALHLDPEGAAFLAAHGRARLGAVTDADYDPIRQMARAADTVVLCEETGVIGPLMFVGTG